MHKHQKNLAMFEIGKQNLDMKDLDKVEIYQNLNIEMQKLWNIRPHVIPTVVVALRKISEKLVYEIGPKLVSSWE